MTIKKCSKCGEVKEEEDFAREKKTPGGRNRACKKCRNKDHTLYRNTEQGYLRDTYYNLGFRRKCSFTFEEFVGAFKKHKSIYGMRSAWGPGIDHLEQHLPMKMIHDGNGQVGLKGCAKGTKRILSNLSVDRLDPNRDYTIQNLIFIRFDENARKHSTSYEDCKIQIRLHEERFINMKAI